MFHLCLPGRSKIFGVKKSSSKTILCFLPKMLIKCQFLLQTIPSQNETLEEKINKVLSINETLRLENEQLKKTLAEKVNAMEAKLHDVTKAINNQKDYLKGEVEKMHFEAYQTNKSLKTEIKETVKNVEEGLENISLSVKKTLEVKESDDNSSQESENSTIAEKIKEITHDELENEEANENQSNQQKLFFRIQSNLNSEFPRSEITRILRKWTTDDVATAFQTSVATVKAIKSTQNESLFLVLLKKKHAKTFKDLLFKYRSLLLKSPILIRSDIVYITRLKKSILGLIAERLRVEKGSQHAACIRRLHPRASLHCVEPGEAEEKIVVYSYKEAVSKYKRFLTNEEIQLAYCKLQHSKMTDFAMRATLLL